MGQVSIDIPRREVAAFCRKHHISRLAVFGSALHGDLRPDSDIDILVEFEPGHTPGLLRLARMQRALSSILGRSADMRTPHDLSRYFRDEVLAAAEVQYAAK